VSSVARRKIRKLDGSPGAECLSLSRHMVVETKLLAQYTNTIFLSRDLKTNISLEKLPGHQLFDVHILPVWPVSGEEQFL